MANNLAIKPWKIDTPSATALFTSHTRISFIEYVGYSDASHSVEVQDSLGNIVALLKGNVDLSGVKYGEDIGWVRGILVPVNQSAIFGAGVNLQSGILRVYIQ